MVDYYDLHTQEFVTEEAYGQGLLERLYGSLIGRLILAWVVKPAFSKTYSLWDYTPLSKGKIQTFVKRYQLDMSHYQKSTYGNFASFFSRQLQSKWVKQWSEYEVGAVAQAKLQVFQVSQNGNFRIKNQDYRLEELLKDAALAEFFQGGTACVYRLGLEDYHRYLVAETGVISRQEKLKGDLHSVRQIAQARYPIFKENVRSFTVIDSECGPVVQMEVGALLVGKIYNHSSLGERIEAGQEKGYFGLGGSSIVVLYPPNTIQIDSVILHYSMQGIESQVQIGQRIGVKNVKKT